jgi:hypothetical protein
MGTRISFDIERQLFYHQNVLGTLQMSVHCYSSLGV